MSISKAKKTIAPCLLACVVFLPALFFLPGCPDPVRQDAVLREDMEYLVLRAVNEERRKAGVRVLEFRADLRSVARAHNAGMVLRAAAGDANAFEHRDQQGRMIEDRLDAYEKSGFHRRPIVWIEAAENLARNRLYNDPVQEAVRGWLASPEHKRNLISPRFRETGIGVHESAVDGTIYVTQIFLLRMPE